MKNCKNVEIFQNKLLMMKSHEESQLQAMESQLSDVTGNGKDENSVDATSYTMQVESLINSKNRLIKHLVQINNALLRIDNNAYGICAETGKSISMERLLAVPTTTLSIEGKGIRANMVY